ncbi:unnamed protein product [Cochlearia groenlandica]
MEKQSIKNTSSSSSYLSSMSSPWIRGTCIGQGSFGIVSTAINKSNGEVFAVKSVDLATCHPIKLESIENEISVLCSLKPHPNIVRYIGDGVTKEGTTSFRNLHLEYLPEGDVANVGIDEILLRRYTASLASALRLVHSQGFVHCDVKAKNVLVCRSSGIKLADFGSAFRIGKSIPTAQILPRGSPLWMAPEVIRREYQGPESDVWSIGCTVIEMFTGKPAWEDLGIDSLSRIGFSDELPDFPVKLSELGRDFLDKCLNRDLTQRWSCDQLLQHPFLSEYNDTESSPRCVLNWVNTGFELEEEEEEDEWRSDFKFAGMARIRNLMTNGGAIWESDGWVVVRSHALEEEREITEHLDSTRVDVSVNPNTPPGNLDSAAALLNELAVVLVLLMAIMVDSTYLSTEIILIIYCCCQYHRDYNNMKLQMLSFNPRLRFCLLAHVIRIRPDYFTTSEEDEDAILDLLQSVYVKKYEEVAEFGEEKEESKDASDITSLL